MLEFWPPTGVSPQQCCTTKPPLYSIKQIPVCFSAVLVGRPVFAKCDSMSVMGEIMIWTSKTYDGGGCIYNLRWHLVVSLSSLTMATSSLAVGGPTFQLSGCHWVPILEGSPLLPWASAWPPGLCAQSTPASGWRSSASSAMHRCVINAVVFV